MAVTTGGSLGVAQMMDALNAYVGVIGIIVAVVSLGMQAFFSYKSYKMQMRVLALDALKKELLQREQAVRSKELELEVGESPIVIT